jgi:hypothetical protein
LDAGMTKLTRGADRLLELHAAELPQKDELCGCFWAVLALRLNYEGPIEQDDVALVAGSVITSHGSVDLLPRGQARRNDYRLELPVTEDDASSGTSAHGVALAVSELTDGRLAACPVSGLDVRRVRALLHAAADATAPVVLVANVQTGAFWGSHPSAAQVAAYLARGDLGAGPAPDWSVGHFVGLVGLSEGRTGALVTVADTYPVLGAGGVHLQPVEAVAAALAGRGVLVVAEPNEARRVAGEAGGMPELWDNGSPARCRSLPSARRAASDCRHRSPGRTCSPPRSVRRRALSGCERRADVAGRQVACALAVACDDCGEQVAVLAVDDLAPPGHGERALRRDEDSLP